MINALFNARNATARRREWLRQDRERRAVERRVASQLSRILVGIVRDVVGGHTPTQVAPRAGRALAASLRRYARAVGSAALDSAEVSRPKGRGRVWSVKRTRYDAFLDEYEDQILEKATSIAEDMAERARDALTGALEQGLGQREAAGAVSAAVGGMAERRANTIARTEMHAVQQASLLAFAEDVNTDVSLDKTWIAVQDDRVRESHAAADGQVVAVGDPFKVGGAELMNPGDQSGPPEETINCRCGMAFEPRENAPTAEVVEPAPPAAQGPEIVQMPASADYRNFSREDVRIANENYARQQEKNKPFLNALSDEERASIARYTGGAYADIRESQRTRTGERLGDADRIQTAVEAAENQGAGFTGDIHRGIRVPDDVAKAIIESKEVVMDAVSSWTADPEVAYNFSMTGNYKDRMMMFTLEGAENNGMVIGDISMHRNEKEVVLGAGSAYDVSRVEVYQDPDGPRYHVYIREKGGSKRRREDRRQRSLVYEGVMHGRKDKLRIEGRRLYL